MQNWMNLFWHEVLRQTGLAVECEQVHCHKWSQWSHAPCFFKWKMQSRHICLHPSHKLYLYWLQASHGSCRLQSINQGRTAQFAKMLLHFSFTWNILCVKWVCFKAVDTTSVSLNFFLVKQVCLHLTLSLLAFTKVYANMAAFMRLGCFTCDSK